MREYRLCQGLRMQPEGETLIQAVFSHIVSLKHQTTAIPSVWLSLIHAEGLEGGGALLKIKSWQNLEGVNA